MTDLGRAAPRRPVFLTALALTAVLISCKVIDLLPAPRGAREFASDLLVAVHQDLWFALGSGAAALVLVRAARRVPRVERVVWSAWLAYSFVSVAYAVFSYRVYCVIYAPLTYRMIAAGGGFAIAWSSLRVWFTAGFTTALISVPFAYLAVARWSGQLRVPSSIVVPALQALSAGALLVLSMEGAHRYEWSWPGRLDRPVADNPHLVLAQSFWSARLGRAARADGGSDDDALVMIQDLGFDFPRADLADFLPGAPGPQAPLTNTPPRNVLVYVFESTSAEYLDAYGATYGATPRISDAASHGVVFDNVVAHIGKSEGSLAGMLLSIYIPLMWRMVTEEMPEIPGTTLAQVLGPKGYRTALLSATDLRYGHQRQFLGHRGFEQVQDRTDFACPEASSWGVADSCLVDNLLRWLDADRARPFFAVAWTNQTHHPYVLPPDRPVRAFDHAQLPSQIGNFDEYLNALAESDRQFGRVLDGLRERGLEDDTLIVITGDHGEAFGEHHPTFLHGFHVYQENVHVPCIFSNPRLFPASKRMPTVGGHIDLNPSIAQILGVPSPSGWQGKSLFDVDRNERSYFFATHRDLILGVREGRWKYILNLTSGDDELYDLEVDRHEQNNESARAPDRRARLRQHLAAWMRAQKDRYRQGQLTVREPPKSP